MATNNADNFTNPIGTSTGGTGLASLTANAVQVGNGSSALTQVVGSTGTVLIGTTGSDPSFSATPSLTSITFGAGNALNDYQEGTWTPTLIGASTAGTTTYTIQQGYYVKIGKIVTIIATLGISAATGTGTAILGGYPFTLLATTGTNPFGSLILDSTGWTWAAGRTQVVLQGTVNTQRGTISEIGSAVASNNMNVFNAAATFYFTLTYIATT